MTPELLNLIFFQQKNIVIFPYIDQKHLKSLETFAIGHSIIDLDCTSLDDVVGIVELESGTYSQNPNLYFLYNATKDIITSLQERENVHCIINTHEDVSQLANEHGLIFYNKKSKRSLNWDFESQDLAFENHLIEKSKGNALVLQDSLMRIKSLATLIYTALVEESSNQSIPILFKEYGKAYDSTYWDRILEFMENYFKIEAPPEVIKKVQEVKTFGNGDIITQTRTKTPLADFSSEYELIISADRVIGNAFVQALHDYRSKHVNRANLEISQLYNPKELYNYLRNHHWKNGIDEVFVNEWFQNPDLVTEQNSKDVKIMFKKLGISHRLVIDQNIEEHSYDSELGTFEAGPSECSIQKKLDTPSIKDFERFKSWIFEKLDEIEFKKI